MPESSVIDLDLPRKTYTTGETVIDEGSDCPGIFVLQSGSVKIVCHGEELCQISSRGAVFGETSAILGSQTTAKVITLEESEFLLIENPREAMQNDAELAFNIAHILAERLKKTTELLVEVKAKLPDHHHESLGHRFYHFMEVTTKFFDRDVKDVF